MENASKALVIAGAILLAILIIAIGMYIYNSSSSAIVSSMSSLSTSEVEAFNNNFEYFRGKQKGSQVSALISRAISNGITYKDEEIKKPRVMLGYKGNDNNNQFWDINPDDYVGSLSEMKSYVEDRHTYNVKFDYNEVSGIISEITIEY